LSMRWVTNVVFIIANTDTDRTGWDSKDNDGTCIEPGDEL